MDRQDVAILISCVSLAAAFFSLGWTVFRDVYLKARLHINFMLAVIVHPTFTKPLWRYSFSVTNLGPGKVRLQGLFVQDYSILKKIMGVVRYAHIVHDFQHPLGGQLPYDLDIGQKLDLSFSPGDCTFLGEGYTRLGIIDSFGRLHWCRKRDMAEAIKTFRERRWEKPSAQLAIER